jgi:hypothetical protein
LKKKTENLFQLLFTRRHDMIFWKDWTGWYMCGWWHYDIKKAWYDILKRLNRLIYVWVVTLWHKEGMIWYLEKTEQAICVCGEMWFVSTTNKVLNDVTNSTYLYMLVFCQTTHHRLYKLLYQILQWYSLLDICSLLCYQHVTHWWLIYFHWVS